MKLYAISLSVLLKKNARLIVLFATAFTGFFLFVPACGRTSSDLKGSTNGHNSETLTAGNGVANYSNIPTIESMADGNDVAKDSNGPTMIMSYSKEKFVKNPIASFMYFVPLIAPTLVDNISSVNNEQQVAIISRKIKVSSKSFHVICEFEVLGSGFHMNTFDPAGMIAAQEEDVKEGKTLTNLLDYIKFDGEGFGIIEVKGEITGSTMTVTEVDIQFNAKGHKSPVTIGLYDVKPKDGEYKYENCSNEVVARVNTLTFEKTEQTPRMGIKVASISDTAEPEGFFSSLKGAIANLFIKPPKVTKLGNNTMLEFGDALLQEKPAFTFPKAANIKESKVVEIDTKQK